MQSHAERWQDRCLVLKALGDQMEKNALEQEMKKEQEKLRDNATIMIF